MNRLAENLLRIASALDDLGVGWAVVGGLAISVRCNPRLTRDVDVAIAAANDAEAERIVRDLGRSGFRPVELVEHESAKRLATARLTAEDQADGVVVDLLFASSGIEKEIVEAAEILEVFSDVRARVARRPHLIAMKLLARDDRFRPQDYDDLRSLVTTISETEIDSVRHLLSLISLRGFARGRDLDQQFTEILDESPNRRPPADESA